MSPRCAVNQFLLRRSEARPLLKAAKGVGLLRNFCNIVEFFMHALRQEIILILHGFCYTEYSM